jgi:hypothetical protein
VDQEQRDRERLSIPGHLRGEVMVFEPIAVKELSEGGVQIESRFPLQLDSLHEFRLTLGNSSVVLKGRIVHCSISDVDQDVVVYRSGVEFVEPPDRVASAIAGFLDAIKAYRQSL